MGRHNTVFERFRKNFTVTIRRPVRLRLGRPGTKRGDARHGRHRRDGHSGSRFQICRSHAAAHARVRGRGGRDAQISNSLTTERMIASLSTVFGFLATVLAIIGLYGVMSYTVAQRAREIGIRMALGAAQGNVVWMVMHEVLRLIAIGIAAGIPAALALTRSGGESTFRPDGARPVDAGVGNGPTGARCLRRGVHPGAARQPPGPNGRFAL